MEQLDFHIYKHYEVVSRVGKGTYGEVYKVRDKKTGHIFAMKKIIDVFQNVTDAKRTYRELNYLLQLSHPCIVKLNHIVPIEQQAHMPRTARYYNTVMFETAGNGSTTEKVPYETPSNPKNQHIYSIFEFVESDLAAAIKACEMQPIQRKYIAFQLVNALVYLHRSGLVHRDIKPSNVLVDQHCDIKLCDFGLCRLKEAPNTHTDAMSILTEYVAARSYRPPEILLGINTNEDPIDMWSLGCLIAELALRQPLFRGNSTMDQIEKIVTVIGMPSHSEINHLPSEPAKFLLKNMAINKRKLHTLDEILNKTTDLELDLITKLLRFDPHQRLSAEEALDHPYFREMAEMGYSYKSYNHPVKIVDYTIITQFSREFSTMNLGISRNQQAHDHKDVKKISIEDYRKLIYELERISSSSRSEFYQVKLQENKVSPQTSYDKQKSTRESNFLRQHYEHYERTKEPQANPSAQYPQRDQDLYSKMTQIGHEQTHTMDLSKYYQSMQVMNHPKTIKVRKRNHSKAKDNSKSISKISIDQLKARNTEGSQRANKSIKSQKSGKSKKSDHKLEPSKNLNKSRKMLIPNHPPLGNTRHTQHDSLHQQSKCSKKKSTSKLSNPYLVKKTVESKDAQKSKKALSKCKSKKNY